jgi:hypothetical protein
MPETRATYRATPRQSDPTYVRDEALQSVQDHIEDTACQLPPTGAHVTAQTLTDARKSYERLGGALTRLEEAQERCDGCGCEARRGMQNDIGLSSFEWGWEQG